MRRGLGFLVVFLVSASFAFSQAIKDEDIKLEISENSPLKGKTVLVFPSASEYSTMDRDQDLKFLVDTVNFYLADLGIEYVDYGRSLELSKGFRAIYEEKRGQAMSLAQMLANETKAPIYIEVDVNMKVEPYSGLRGWVLVEGIVNMKAYDSATARGLGTSHHGKKVYNNAIDEDKAKKVVLSYIAKAALKDLLPKCEKYLMKGEKIEVKVIGFRGLREVKNFLDFITALPGSQEVKRRSVSGDLAIFDVVYKGGVEEFLNDLADLALSHPEYEKIKVDQTGNSVTLSLK